MVSNFCPPSKLDIFSGLGQTVKIALVMTIDTSPAAIALNPEILAILDELPTFTWIASNEGPVLYMNPRAEALFGESRESLCARWTTLVHPDDLPMVINAQVRSLETGIMFSVESRYVLHDGSARWFQVQARPLRDSEGRIIYWLGASVDIHDKRTTNEALQASEARYRERLEVIERQAQEISELSTPIIEVWEGTVVMPLFGTLDASRAERMMQVLLDAISNRQCVYAIIDLTGAATMDAATAEHVGRLLSAVRLLGAQGIVVGIRPDVARTWTTHEVDLTSIIVRANLREALLFVRRNNARF